jgi:hypothetical protein
VVTPGAVTPVDTDLRGGVRGNSEGDDPLSNSVDPSRVDRVKHKSEVWWNDVEVEGSVAIRSVEGDLPVVIALRTAIKFDESLRFSVPEFRV